jgi:hypothetical protein
MKVPKISRSMFNVGSQHTCETHHIDDIKVLQLQGDCEPHDFTCCDDICKAYNELKHTTCSCTLGCPPKKSPTINVDKGFAECQRENTHADNTNPNCKSILTDCCDEKNLPNGSCSSKALNYCTDTGRDDGGGTNPPDDDWVYNPCFRFEEEKGSCFRMSKCNTEECSIDGFSCYHSSEECISSNPEHIWTDSNKKQLIKDLIEKGEVSQKVAYCISKKIEEKYSFQEFHDLPDNDPISTPILTGFATTCIAKFGGGNRSGNGSGNGSGSGNGGGNGLSKGPIIGIVAGAILLICGLIVLYMSINKKGIRK